MSNAHPQTIIRQKVSGRRVSEAHFSRTGGGGGLRLSRRKVVQHGGNIDGMSAWGDYAEEKPRIAISRTGMEQLFRRPDQYDFRWSPSRHKGLCAELYKSITGSWSSEGRGKEKEEPGSPDQHVAATREYAGTYKTILGEAKVTVKTGIWPQATGRHSPETWITGTTRRSGSVARSHPRRAHQFTLCDDGKVRAENREPTLSGGPDPADTSAGIKMSEEALSKFAGKYAMTAPPIEVSLEMIGGQLKATVPGQPVYTLVPVSPTRFRIDGAPAGYFIQFEVANDKPKAMTIEQGPTMSFKLLPKQ